VLLRRRHPHDHSHPPGRTIAAKDGDFCRLPISSVLAGGAADQKRVSSGKFLAEAPAGLIQGDPATPSATQNGQCRARRCRLLHL